MKSTALLWSAFAALVLASAYLLFRACEFVTPFAGAWSFCPVQAAERQLREEERTAVLQAEVHRLRLEVASREAQCYAELQPKPPPVR